MAFQPVPNTASVTFRFDGSTAGVLTGCKAQSTLYVNSDSAPWDMTNLQQLADYCEDWWTSGKNGGQPARGDVATAWILTDIVARDLEVQGGGVVIEPVGTAGLDTNQPAPPNCPFWIKFRGEPGQLPKDGGVFWPAGTEANIDGSFWQGAVTLAIRQRFIDWRTDLNDPMNGGNLSWAHVIVSRSVTTDDSVKQARAALRAAIAATRRAEGIVNNVDDLVVRELLGSQRDRRSGEPG